MPEDNRRFARANLSHGGSEVPLSRRYSESFREQAARQGVERKQSSLLGVLCRQPMFPKGWSTLRMRS